MKRIITCFAVVAFLFVTPGIIAGEYNKGVRIDDEAPSISGIHAVFLDKDGVVQTTQINLPQIKQDIVVLVFVANHCPFVVANEERLNAFVKDFKEKGVKVVALSVSKEAGDDPPGIKEYVKKHKSAYVYGYDASQDVGRAYGATNTPQYFVLDKERKIRYMGALDDVPKVTKDKKPTKHHLRDAVNALLEEREPPVKETRSIGCGIEYEKKPTSTPAQGGVK